jgi:hypothetical protein
MAAAVTGSKTVTLAAAGTTPTELTTILATAPENLTVAQLIQLQQALQGNELGSVPTATLGSILT